MAVDKCNGLGRTIADAGTSPWRRVRVKLAMAAQTGSAIRWRQVLNIMTKTTLARRSDGVSRDTSVA